MSSDIINSAMPDFRAPHFAAQLAAFSNGNRELGASFLMSLTAAMLGLPVEFFRAQSSADCVIRTFPPTFDFPTFFRIKSGKRQHHFWASVSDVSVPLSAARDTRDNSRAKLLLSKAGVPTPVGGALTASNTTVLDGLVKQGVERFVLKPLFANRPMAPVADVTLDQVRAQLMADPSAAFLVTEHVIGAHMRFQVMDNIVVSALLILSPHIVGDGQRTLAEHLDIKRRLQAGHPFYANTVYDRDRILNALERDGLMSEDVLPAGKRIDLPVDAKGHIPEILDFTSQLDAKFAEPVIKTAKCFGLKVAQVDAVLSENGNFFVQGLNGRCDLLQSCLPFMGDWNLRAPEAILKSHFPKTTNQPRRVENFDFVKLVKDYQAKKSAKILRAQDYLGFS